MKRKMSVCNNTGSVLTILFFVPFSSNGVEFFFKSSVTLMYCSHCISLRIQRLSALCYDRVFIMPFSYQVHFS